MQAIHGFRETERKKWYPKNRELLERVREVAFNGAIMPYVHILDLAADGVIKPHVDSIRVSLSNCRHNCIFNTFIYRSQYCGNTISGISLLSDSVMRLVRTDAQKYKQNSSSDNTEDTAYRQQPAALLENNFYADLLLPRRSLYIMSHTARYNFTHEILANEHSKFLGNPIQKTRRISIICRNEP